MLVYTLLVQSICPQQYCHVIIPMTYVARAILVLWTATPPSNTIHILVALGRVLSKIYAYHTHTKASTKNV